MHHSNSASEEPVYKKCHKTIYLSCDSVRLSDSMIDVTISFE